VLYLLEQTGKNLISQICVCNEGIIFGFEIWEKISNEIYSGA
jgi:hypothetical protein